MFTSAVQGAQAQASASAFHVDYRDLNYVLLLTQHTFYQRRHVPFPGDSVLQGHMFNVFKPSLCLKTLTLGYPIPDSTTLIIPAIFIFSDEESETSLAH